MKKLILFSLGIIVFSGGFFPNFSQTIDEAEWINAEGEAAIANISPERAQQIALNEARLEAVSTVSLEITGLEYIKNMRLANKAIMLFQSGEIVDESILKWEVIVDQQTETVFPELLCRVKYRARVASRGEPDPAFRIRAKPNKKHFTDGDEIILKVKSTQDCYLTILNWQYNDKIVLLVPGPYKQANQLSAHQEIEIPSAQEREYWGFTAHSVDGRESIHEAIFVIATKKKVDFLLDGDNRGSNSYQEVPFTDFQEWLSSIPISERAQAVIGYEVFDSF